MNAGNSHYEHASDYFCVKQKWSSLVKIIREYTETLCEGKYTALGTFARLRKATISFIKSVSPCGKKKSDLILWIFLKFGFGLFFENLLKKVQVLLKSDKNNGHFTRRPMYINNDISLNSS
jgi:hypothetical protein